MNACDVRSLKYVYIIYIYTPEFASAKEAIQEMNDVESIFAKKAVLRDWKEGKVAVCCTSLDNSGKPMLTANPFQDYS